MTTVEVFLDDDGEPRLVGTAHFTRSRGQVSTTFLYDAAYLAGDGVAIDPALPLAAGAHYQPGLVGAFADSVPDRWGRNLLEKGERARARELGRVPRRLDDVDFLLGVSDDTRQGALRFRVAGERDFNGPPSTVPPLVSLPALLKAAHDVTTQDDPSVAVKRLLDTGTTGLGGARPKAAVRLEDGSLAIAKFPHGSDEWDVLAWEAVALDVLERAGLRVAPRRLVSVGRSNVLLVRRFDRTDTGRRVGYLSAMTAVGATDGDRRDYADLAEAVRDLSASPRREQHELFDRVVASVALGNTDDHLRNHGLLAAGRGWALSPVFDVNPTPDPGRARATSVMGADTAPEEAETLLALASECSLTAADARAHMRRVVEAVRDWREVARSHGISVGEIRLMAESIEPRTAAVLTAAEPHS